MENDGRRTKKYPSPFSHSLKPNPKPSQPPSPSLIAELFSSSIGCWRDKAWVPSHSSHRRTLRSSHRSSSRRRRTRTRYPVASPSRRLIGQSSSFRALSLCVSEASIPPRAFCCSLSELTSPSPLPSLPIPPSLSLAFLLHRHFCLRKH